MVKLGPLDNTNSLGNERQFIDSWSNAYLEYKLFENNLTFRINYIISKIYEEYNENYSGLFYINKNTGGMTHCYECGGPEVNLYDYFGWKFIDSSQKYIEYEVEGTYLNAQGRYDDYFINLGEKFPKEWIFSNFEEELKQYKQNCTDYNEKRKAEKLKLKSLNKEDKAKFKEQLKAKLTPEELALISFKK
jgi:hypothetical protein